MKRPLFILSSLALAFTLNGHTHAQSPSDFQGPYIGLNAGYGSGKAPFRFSEDLPGPEGRYFRFKPKGMFGGVQAGYNWQSGNWIYGLETDLQVSDIKQRLGGTLNYIDDDGDRVHDKWNNSVKVRWFGSTRLKVGHLVSDRTLLYGTAGLAYGQYRASIHVDDLIDPDDSVSYKKTRTRVGYTLGAGLEHAIDKKWSVKGEYLYTDLGRSTILRNHSSFLNETFKISTKMRFHTVRVGVNYRF